MKALQNKYTPVLLAIAVFAVTIGSVQAFDRQAVLETLELTDDQLAALEVAHELRHEGDKEAAKEVLEAAGIDRELMRGIKDAVKTERKAHRQERKAEIETQLTEDQLEALQVAREANDKEAARAILEEAGIELPERMHRHGGRGE